jgi:hypothetical protein
MHTPFIRRMRGGCFFESCAQRGLRELREFTKRLGLCGATTPHVRKGPVRLRVFEAAHREPETLGLRRHRKLRKERHARARLNHLRERCQARGTKCVFAELGPRAECKGLIAQAVAFVEEQHVSASQLGRRESLMPLGERMGRVRGQHERVNPNLGVFDNAQVRFECEQRAINGPRFEARDEGRRLLFDPRDAQARKGNLRRWPDGRKQVGRDRRNDADSQGSRKRISKVFGRTSQVIRFDEDAPGPSKERRACGREPHVAVVALEQLNAERALKLGNLRRERRLGHATTFRRFSKREFLRHGGHVLKLAKREDVRGAAHDRRRLPLAPVHESAHTTEMPQPRKKREGIPLGKLQRFQNAECPSVALWSARGIVPKSTLDPVSVTSAGDAAS